MDSDSAADLRSAISRSYYAAFLVGSEALRAFGFRVPESPGAHEGLARRLSNCANSEVKLAGRKLQDLRARRLDADYRMSNTNVEKKANAKIIVEQSRQVIEALDTVWPNDEKEEIVSSILHYETTVLGTFWRSP